MIDIRASSLPELFDCPARWEAKNLRGLRLPKTEAAQLGTAVHAGTALFDQSRLDGTPLTADEAAGAVVDAVHRPQEDVDWGDGNPREAEKIGVALHMLYCREIAPGRDYVAVEARCGRLVISDLGIALTGTTDRVYRDASGDLGVADIKTGKSAVAIDGTVKTAGHAAQLAVYELLAEAALNRPLRADALIIGLQAAKTDRGRRAGIGQIACARELLVGDEDNPGLLDMAAGLLRRGDFFGNPRSALCNKKFCPAWATCRWR